MSFYLSTCILRLIVIDLWYRKQCCIVINSICPYSRAIPVSPVKFATSSSWGWHLPSPLEGDQRHLGIKPTGQDTAVSQINTAHGTRLLVRILFVKCGQTRRSHEESCIGQYISNTHETLNYFNTLYTSSCESNVDCYLVCVVYLPSRKLNLFKYKALFKNKEN